MMFWHTQRSIAFPDRGRVSSGINYSLPDSFSNVLLTGKIAKILNTKKSILDEKIFNEKWFISIVMLMLKIDVLIKNTG